MVNKISIFCACVMIISSAAAESSKGSIENFLKSNEPDIKSVTLVLLPSNIRTVRALAETDVVKMGCSFNLSGDSKANEQIFSIIKENISLENNPVGKVYLRNIISLHLKDNSSIKFTFGDAANPNEKVYGGVSMGGGGSYIPFSSNYVFLDKIRSWVKIFIEKGEIASTKTRDCLRNG